MGRFMGGECWSVRVVPKASKGGNVIGAKIDELELMEVSYEDNPTMHLRVNFPFYVGTGTKNTAVVYFEIEPNCGLGMNADSTEEIVLVLEGEAEATVGDESGRVSAGEMAVLPAMVPHGFRNVGNETVRVVGFFSRNVVASTFDWPLMPFGQLVAGTPPVLAEEEVASEEAHA
jgi:quercetin dioxygenase-like cupin family protein